jgi:hypothetical protein
MIASPPTRQNWKKNKKKKKIAKIFFLISFYKFTGFSLKK